MNHHLLLVHSTLWLGRQISYPSRAETVANVLLILVPAHFAADAIMETPAAGIELIVFIAQKGWGQSTCIGTGGDPTIGTTMKDLLEIFEADPGAKATVMIGEVGGSMEIEAARYAKDNVSKAVIGFIAGRPHHPGAWAMRALIFPGRTNPPPRRRN